MTRYLLDTNIISNIVKRQPSELLLAWWAGILTPFPSMRLTQSILLLLHCNTNNGATVGRDCGIETKVSVERTLSV